MNKFRKMIFATFPIWCWLVGDVIVLANDNSLNERQIKGVSQSLLSLVEAANRSSIDIDASGQLVRIGLPSRLNTDSNLAVVAACDTVTNLTIWFTRKGNPSLSKAGFDSLHQLSRLDSLEVGCCELIPSDMFLSICQLTNLRVLRLNRAEPSVADYACLTNLTRLEELHIGEAKNFGDHQFERLNILPLLRKINLNVSSTSYGCLDAVSSFPSLTNLVITKGEIGVGKTLEKIEWTKQ